MNVLEKILKEIDAVLMSNMGKKREGLLADDRIIRSHMNDAKDLNVPTNDCWIPVSERLPEDGRKVLVWYEYFRYGDYNCMYQTHGIGFQYQGHWSGDVSGTNARCIAWKPLPEPYRPQEG